MKGEEGGVETKGVELKVLLLVDGAVDKSRYCSSQSEGVVVSEEG